MDANEGEPQFLLKGYPPLTMASSSPTETKFVRESNETQPRGETLKCNANNAEKTTTQQG